GPVRAPALKRAFPPRVNRSQQGAHVSEKVHRLAAGQPLPDIRQQIARAMPVARRGTRLPLALALPPTAVRVPSALRHRRQPTDSLQSAHSFAGAMAPIRRRPDNPAHSPRLLPNEVAGPDG